MTNTFSTVESRPVGQSVELTNPFPGDPRPSIWRIRYNHTLQNMEVPAGVEWMFFNAAGQGDNLVHGGQIGDRSGVFETSVDTQCWRSGSYQVRFNVNPCGTNFYTTGTFTVDNMPVVSLALAKNAAGNQVPRIHYRFPNTNTPDRRGLRLEWADMPGYGIWFGTAPEVEGDLVVPIELPAQTGRRRLRVVATSCSGEEADAFAAVECCCEPGGPPCEVGEPIRLWDGAVTYSDRDPYPPTTVVSLIRTYDSSNQSEGRFGTGWTSVFDASLVRVVETEFDTVHVKTEADNRPIFRKVGGAWRQIWPQGTGNPGELIELAGGGFTHRDGGSSLIREYQGGRLVVLRDAASDRATTITYHASGVPLSIADEWDAWSATVTTVGGLVTGIAVDGHPEMNEVYTYSGSLLQSVTLDGAAWRTYAYAAGLLSAAHDGAGDLIESHTYDAHARGISSVSQSDDITNVEYLGTAEATTRVTYASGRVETYTLSYRGGRPRTSGVDGGCSTCGLRDAVYAFDTEGHVLRQQDAAGYVDVFTYDASGRISSSESHLKPAACDPATDPAHCRFTSSALATASLAPTAVTLSETYTYGDALWPDRPTETRTVSVLNPAGERVRQIVYHAATGQAVVDSMAGWTGDPPVSQTRVTTSSVYDGSESAAFNPGGAFNSSWLTLPQPYGLRKSVDGPRTDLADVTQFVYYPNHTSVPALLRGHLAAVKNAAGHITRNEEYDVFGHVTRAADANGVASESTFDAQGRGLATSLPGIPGCDTSADPLCSTTLTSVRAYHGTARLATSQNPGGGVTTWEYEDRGRVESMSRGPSSTDLRERLETSYDPASGLKSQERYLAREGASWIEKRRVSFEYDSFLQLQRMVHADGSSVAYTYDPRGLVGTVRDERHATANTFYAYDPAGRLSEVRQTLSTAPGGSILTHYAYDVHGNLISVADPNGNVTAYVYDDFGQLLRQESPVSGATLHDYDPAGQATSTTDANGAVTTRSYDALGRVLTSDAIIGENPDHVAWTYDTGVFGVGRTATMSDPYGSTMFTHERRGLLTSESRTTGEGIIYVSSFRYDADGNRSRITYPSGRQVDYAFDYADRPVSAVSGPVVLVTSATYLPFGPPTSRVFGNGTSQSMSYDARYRILGNDLTGPAGAIAQYAYAPDAAGNITEIHDTLAASYNRDFGYDDLNRLVTATGGASLWGTGTYSYDPMGNLLSRSLGSSASSFSYSGTSPKILTATENGVERGVGYDPAGNEAMVGSETLSYSARNLLTNAGGVAYGYDGRGVRASALTNYWVTALTLDAPSVIGGGVVEGEVTISTPGPWEGISVRLTSSSGKALVPESVVVGGWAPTATFSVATSAVSSTEAVTITASLGMHAQSAMLLIQPGGSAKPSLPATNIRSKGANRGKQQLRSSEQPPPGGRLLPRPSP